MKGPKPQTLPAQKPATSSLVLDEQQALASYLDSLLQEIPDFDAPETALASPEPDVALATQTAGGAGNDKIAHEGERPAWAQAPFQCLLFKVAGLSLAVPLVKLNGIIPMPKEVTPMPGHAAWFLGLIQHYERKVKLVDVGPIVLPDGYERSPTEPTHVILIDNYIWGMACEGITETITLRPEDVRWRSTRGARAWLAGTVIKHMCAILDIDSLAASLHKGDWQIEQNAVKSRRAKARS
ncbi:chemotaxis protein CheW [Thiorhodospira sibirica]|uniref:chemotaxis protein CheW n=1 Tax=Thiorhodospira sibirica TaxID=154347 RepID=UPI00022C4C3D|nr:chemotaxis protein CheW [Thiorhodospira sibirica]